MCKNITHEGTGKNEETARKQGYAIDNEESFPGIRCVAAPIDEGAGKVEAAISIIAPRQRMGQERMKEIMEEVVESAQSISKSIGMKE
jgi:IclR family acetate operon transcriptional repressor